MYFCRDINHLIMSYVESYTGPNEFFNKLATWMERTINNEYAIFGNLEKVFFEIHVRCEPVKPNTYHVLPWEPEIVVLWDGDIKRPVIKIGWLNRASMINLEDFETIQTINRHFDFELLWPRAVPEVPEFMFDIESYYMGETEDYTENYAGLDAHNLDFVPRQFGAGRMLNAAACARWLELS